jgi:esterase/lipase superfamily enzyme
MVSNREPGQSKLGRDRVPERGKPRLEELNYWSSTGAKLTELRSWTKLTLREFKRALIEAADGFPLIEDPARHEEQKHLTIFIHGYNNDWDEAVEMYRKVHARLFSGPESLGICVLFSWPSDGQYLGYFPDRLDARSTAPDLAAILNELYDWMLVKQVEGVAQPAKACRAKLSVIAHSMGNYVLQKAMQYTWSRKNQSLLVSLVNQLLMVAADVDNDLFKGGEATDKSDGDAIANLTYRVTAAYTGRDPVLGLSAGLKHFGKRRLGRSGLDQTQPVSDNVWDVDCTHLIPKNANNVHSAYFDAPKAIGLMRQVLRGVDRKVIQDGFGRR